MIKSVSGNGHELHTYTVIEFPYTDLALDLLLECGTLTITIDGSFITASAHKQGWVMAVRQLLQSSDRQTRQLGSVIVGTFPELFRNLNRELHRDGTLTCT